jgi:Nucleotidyl transferase AbiEii toxin, Type IV TA system
MLAGACSRTRRSEMERPAPDVIDAYCQRFNVTPDVAWRDYLQLLLAEATSRDAEMKESCVWKGAFVMRFVVGSYRSSGDLDATAGTLKKHDLDPQRMYQRLKKACQDMGIDLPKPHAVDARDQSITFDPIEWRDAEIGTVVTSIDLSLREDLVLPARVREVSTGLIEPFEVLHIDMNEQAAEKMRCLSQRNKIGDAWDVELLWGWRTNLDAAVIRKVVAHKLTSGKNHADEALRRLQIRYGSWDDERGRNLPLTGGPTKDEMYNACRAAIKAWIP